MEKDFIPFDRSIRMKDLGFDEPCFGEYTKTEYTNPSVVINDDGYEIVANDDEIERKKAPALTFSHAFRWFRKNNYCRPAYVPLTIAKFISIDEMNYEEAELACLDTLLEFVEAKKD